jgi:threonine dehydrogenase-like Zn-dependent dehydrogenase
MKALQLVKPRHFQTVDVARPQIGDDQILVRLEKVVLCGSDIPKFTGMWHGLQYPLPVGMPIHECVGTVADSQSPRFQVGDRVVAVPVGDQGLAEYYVAVAGKAVHIPEPLVDSEVNLLIQPLSTVVYGLDRLGDVAGRRAVVVGLGPIGLLVTWLLSQHGAQVAGVDPIAWRCEAARRLGAARTLEVHSERVLSLATPGEAWEAADICVEAVGQQTRTINDCLYLVKRCGQVLALGVPLEPVYPFDYMRFFRQNLQMIASVTPPDETYMERAAELIRGHEGELAFLITHRFGLPDAAEAFTLYETRAVGEPLKIVIDGTNWPGTV